MGYLTWWNFPKKAWLIILGELSAVVTLSVSLYLTYLNDAYFQSYANGLSPMLVPVLSVAFGISSASIAAYLYVGIRRIQIERDPESPVKKKTSHPSRIPGDNHRETALSSKNETLAQPNRTRLKPVALTHSRTRPTPKESENHPSVPEPKKQP